MVQTKLLRAVCGILFVAQLKPADTTQVGVAAQTYFSDKLAVEAQLVPCTRFNANPN